MMKIMPARWRVAERIVALGNYSRKSMEQQIGTHNKSNQMYCGARLSLAAPGLVRRIPLNVKKARDSSQAFIEFWCGRRYLKKPRLSVWRTAGPAIPVHGPFAPGPRSGVSNSMESVA